MHLKSLQIKGFKSFADAATLDFEPGVSVIVGPNGSGKSNVVDAMAWVLGAQAPSSVRSQKMDDVIFAGTQTRPALGRAEVSLVIDNSTGTLPIEFNEVKITRVLFRTGESEYSMNGVPCRLLDIQELLSDAGVGRQQHVIISQGQIDAVLNARPEERRLIIEEAAGVLKYRKRKEKAERRLQSTESNLTRLQDLLREARRQLKPLERQAEAARRQVDIVTELTSLRRYLAGREWDALQKREASNRSDRREHGDTSRRLETELADLDVVVRSAEDRLSGMGGADLGDLLATFESLSERARGQLMVVAEKRRNVAQERESFIDQEVAATLEADAAAVRTRLIEVRAEQEHLGPDADDLAAEAAELDEVRRAFDEELAERRDHPQLPLGGFGVDGGAPDSPEQAADAVASRQSLLDALGRASEERGAADALLAEAEEHRRLTDASAQSWLARVDALTLAHDEGRARAGADRLADVPGFLGTLLDVVAIGEGYEAAFEAAVGEAITAVVLNDPASAREGLATLASGQLTGAVLALGLRSAGWPELAGIDALADQVDVRDPRATDLVSQLIGGVAVVDSWPDAVGLAIDHPNALIVTRSGDRFGPMGWRLGSGSSPVTRAALEEAQTQAGAASEAARTATADLASARSFAEIARRRESDLSRQLGRAFDDARSSLESRSRELAARRADLDVRHSRLAQQAGDLAARLGELERKLEHHAERRDQAAHRLAVIDQRDVHLASLSDTAGALLQRATSHLEELRRQRQKESEATRAISADLDTARRRRSATEQQLTTSRQRFQRAEIEHAELKVKIQTTLDMIRDQLQIEPPEALATPLPDLPLGVAPDHRVRELERELRIMGPINPLALQEFEELSERHEFLKDQLDDVKSSRRDLFKVITEVDHEIVAVFTAAFADVATNFEALFQTLFPGGQGGLKLTDPGNMLETGVEVEARPGGKNVKKLSLLSGGERSLTALAFLFAVFRSRPSPFYVMDEVEAALDDINLHRFLDLVAEFRQDAQLIIVSHQKRTMEAADCLYGVSMQPGGSSKVLSERVDNLAST